jgi:ABC-type Fe3+/spermidine/putrescine transport system ATPase subunit
MANGNGTKVVPIMKRKNRFISDKIGNLHLIDENYKPNENIQIGLFSKKNTTNIRSVDTSFNKKRENWYFSANIVPEKIIEKKEKAKSFLERLQFMQSYF